MKKSNAIAEHDARMRAKGLLPVAEVAEAVGVHYTSIARGVQTKTIPGASVLVGPRKRRWYVDVNAATAECTWWSAEARRRVKQLLRSAA